MFCVHDPPVFHILPAAVITYTVEPFGRSSTSIVSVVMDKKVKRDLPSHMSRDFKKSIDAHLWAEVVERINSGNAAGR